MDEREGYYRVVLKATHGSRVSKSWGHESISNDTIEIRAETIKFQERFLFVQISQKLEGFVFGDPGTRYYTYWIPYDSILYIEHVIRTSETSPKTDNGGDSDGRD